MAAGAYSNGTEVAAQLQARAATVLPSAVSVVRHSMLMDTQIKANASGRPGPNAPTGDYRRSRTHEVHVGADAVTAIVGTNKPQALRLEYGYVGPDSLGRIFNQPPYAHVGPAMETVRPLFVEALGRITDGNTP